MEEPSTASSVHLIYKIVQYACRCVYKNDHVHQKCECRFQLHAISVNRLLKVLISYIALLGYEGKRKSGLSVWKSFNRCYNTIGKVSGQFTKLLYFLTLVNTEMNLKYMERFFVNQSVSPNCNRLIR